MVVGWPENDLSWNPWVQGKGYDLMRLFGEVLVVFGCDGDSML